jgi:hypothetical protein
MFWVGVTSRLYCIAKELQATSKQNMGSFRMRPDDSRARLLLRCALAASTPASVQLNSCRQKQ